MHRLGIMVHKITDPYRFLPYYKVGKEEGFDEVIIFTPEHVDLVRSLLHGFIYINQEWKTVSRSFPAISIDIGYYTKSEQIQLVQKIKHDQRIPFVGYGLGNKWTIQKHLVSSDLIAPFLLPTKMARNSPTILNMVNAYHSIMIKPLNGKGGQGIFRLSQNKSLYLLEDTAKKQTTELSLSQLERSLNKLLSKEKYLVQKWIDIRNPEGHIFDIRALVQKNKEGNWQLTGMGVREAPKDKLTSNLTGGGLAYPVLPYLSRHFGKEKASQLVDTLEKLAIHIPSYLEKSYQRRLVELGLDLAVDRTGKVWIIEVNIKPGRTLWKKIGDEEADDLSLRAPVQYARYLLESESV